MPQFVTLWPHTFGAGDFFLDMLASSSSRSFLASAFLAICSACKGRGRSQCTPRMFDRGSSSCMSGTQHAKHSCAPSCDPPLLASQPPCSASHRPSTPPPRPVPSSSSRLPFCPLLALASPPEARCKAELEAIVRAPPAALRTCRSFLPIFFAGSLDHQRVHTAADSRRHTHEKPDARNGKASAAGRGRRRRRGTKSWQEGKILSGRAAVYALLLFVVLIMGA